MSWTVRGNTRMAISNIKNTMWRSTLMIIGIMVAVVPVMLVLGIGEGVKRQITDQVSNLGSDMLTIRPGHLSSLSETEGSDNVLRQLSVFGGYSSSGTFTDRDVQAVNGVRELTAVTPVSVVPGAIEVNDELHDQAFVVGTTENFPELINRSVQHGEFFTANEYGRRVAVVGRGAAEQIFGDGIPLGRAFEFQGQIFIVRGVLERFETPPLSFNTNFNNAVLVPYPVAADVTGSVSVNEILARPAAGVSNQQAVRAVEGALSESRGGSHDFSVLTQAENLRVANSIMSTITAFVTAVAAITLLVGGIGIMNIMLVSVTERMHEIGVRKAIGATKRQIMTQFMAEAVVLSIIGAALGIVAAYIGSYFMLVFTDVSVVMTWQAAVAVFIITVAVGVLFGTIPAIKAARKDPIAALRHE